MQAKQTIVIVDDEAYTLELLKEALEWCDFEVYTANEGEAAIKLLRRHSVDLMITDLVMPGKEGLETIAEVHKEFPKIKILVVSGFEHYFRTAILFGANEVMSKPVSTEVLCNKAIEMLRT